VTAVGVDTGGTFTDFVAIVGGRFMPFKVPSTPAAPERAVLEGLKRAGATKRSRVRHGSTVATNTLLERKGARVTLLTNQGFEDLLEIGRQDRPDLYALAPRRDPPLVPRARRIGVSVRRAADGSARRPLRDSELTRVLAALRRSRPEAVAIGLLHAYAAPEDERRLARAARRIGVPVSVSSELCPEIREYERFTTTVVNAYLQPRVARYLDELSRACGPRLEIVASHGGGVPADRAAREPVRQLLSGPAAGPGRRFARPRTRAHGSRRPGGTPDRWCSRKAGCRAAAPGRSLGSRSGSRCSTCTRWSRRRVDRRHRPRGLLAVGPQSRGRSGPAATGAVARRP
jgi:N-methylhydantoinase A